MPLLLALVSTTSFAQPSVKIRQPPPVPPGWERLVGKDVVVEGIAWGLDKGRSFYVIYYGGTVNIHSTNGRSDVFDDILGRVVRVYGRFVKYPPHSTPSGVQAPRGYPEDRYAIRIARIEFIERVGSPRLSEYRPHPKRRAVPSR